MRQSLQSHLHYLLQRARGNVPAPWSDFDSDWYCTQYPDIESANVSPWMHYFLHGAAEGRLPNAEHAKLWATDSNDSLVIRLKTQAGSKDRFVADNAAWILARWYAKNENWHEVVEAMAPFAQRAQEGAGKFGASTATKLLWIDALRHNNRLDDAHSILGDWMSHSNPDHTLNLAKANLLADRAEQSALPDGRPWCDWVATINKIYASSSLAPLTLTDPSGPLSLDNLGTSRAPLIERGPLVSVIVPAYNAAQTLATVLRSLQHQSWQPLEILVVDDCSSDGTLEIAHSFAREDERIRVIAQQINGGAYCVRNIGLQESTGDFITVHDSDDWSHAQKIQTQVSALLTDNGLVASLSHWCRATTNLRFGGWNSPESWASWTHRNVSSLMIRRAVFEDLGFWDQVRCSADTEYYYRIIKAYGRSSITEVHKGTPLGLGRIDAQSLTQQSSTNIFTLFGGLRKQYHDAYAAWHQSASDRSALFLQQHPASRPFPVPSGMLSKSGSASTPLQQGATSPQTLMQHGHQTR